MKRIVALLVLGMVTFAIVGCDAKAKVDSDGAAVKVDKKD